MANMTTMAIVIFVVHLHTKQISKSPISQIPFLRRNIICSKSMHSIYLQWMDFSKVLVNLFRIEDIVSNKLKLSTYVLRWQWIFEIMLLSKASCNEY